MSEINFQSNLDGANLHFNQKLTYDYVNDKNVMIISMKKDLKLNSIICVCVCVINDSFIANKSNCTSTNTKITNSRRGATGLIEHQQ